MPPWENAIKGKVEEAHLHLFLPFLYRNIYVRMNFLCETCAYRNIVNIKFIMGISLMMSYWWQHKFIHFIHTRKLFSENFLCEHLSAVNNCSTMMKANLNDVLPRKLRILHVSHAFYFFVVSCVSRYFKKFFNCARMSIQKFFQLLVYYTTK